jgi:hypothetical protein
LTSEAMSVASLCRLVAFLSSRRLWNRQQYHSTACDFSR